MLALDGGTVIAGSLRSPGGTSVAISGHDGIATAAQFREVRAAATGANLDWRVDDDIEIQITDEDDPA